MNCNVPKLVDIPDKNKTYLYKDGIVNTDFIGNLILPSSIKFENGYINVSLGGGDYDYHISTERPFKVTPRTCIFFEFTDVTLKTPIYIGTPNSSGALTTQYFQPGFKSGTIPSCVISSGYYFDDEVKNLVRYWSASQSNIFKHKITKIWIEEI